MGKDLDILVEELASKIKRIVGAVPVVSIARVYLDLDQRTKVKVESASHPHILDHPFVDVFQLARKGAPIQPCYQKLPEPTVIKWPHYETVSDAQWYHPIFRGNRTHVLPVSMPSGGTGGIVTLTYRLERPYGRRKRKMEAVEKVVQQHIPLIHHLLEHAHYRLAVVFSPEESLRTNIMDTLHSNGYQSVGTGTVEDTLAALDRAPAKHEHGFDAAILSDGALASITPEFLAYLLRRRITMPVIHLGQEKWSSSLANYESLPLDQLQRPGGFRAFVTYPPLIGILDERIKKLDDVRDQAVRLFLRTMIPEAAYTSGHHPTPFTLASKLTEAQVYRDRGVLHLQQLLDTGVFSTTLSRDGVIRVQLPPHMKGPNFYVRKGNVKTIKEMRDLYIRQARILRRAVRDPKLPGAPSLCGALDLSLHFAQGNDAYLVTREAGPDAFESFYTQDVDQKGLQHIRELCMAAMEFNALLPRHHRSVKGWDESILAYIRNTVDGALQETELALGLYPFSPADKENISGIFRYLRSEIPLVEESLSHRFIGLRKHTCIDSFPANLAHTPEGAYVPVDLGNLRAQPLACMIAGLLTINNQFDRRDARRGLDLTVLKEGIATYNSTVGWYNALVEAYHTDRRAFIQREIELDMEDMAWMRELQPILQLGYPALSSGNSLREVYREVRRSCKQGLETYLHTQEPFASDRGLRATARSFVRSYIQDLWRYACTLEEKELESGTYEEQVRAYEGFQFFKSPRFVGHLLRTSHLSDISQPLEPSTQVNLEERYRLLRPLPSQLWRVAEQTLDVAIDNLADFGEHPLEQRAELTSAFQRLGMYIHRASAMEPSSKKLYPSRSPTDLPLSA